LFPFWSTRKAAFFYLKCRGKLAGKLGSWGREGGGFWGITRVFPATPPFKISTDDYSSS